MKKFVFILLALSLCLASCEKIEQMLGIEKDVIGQEEQSADSSDEDGEEPGDEPGDQPEGPVETVTPLGEFGQTANCYVVSQAGTYSIPTVKGNSAESVGSVASAEVLWESFGTDETPTVGDIIEQVQYEATTGKIVFSTPTTLRNGNAVIAAKDASGEILWSWHIWVCKDFDPDATVQEYYNNAGVMMDRNLGATSATPGDVGALGLLYQWGRKDPFLGSSSISSNNQAASTLSWPSPVGSGSSTGTIDYAVKNPTAFINSTNQNHDWYYTGGFLTEDNRWQSTKTIYDPCPPGWKVPTGGSGGVWSKATNTSGDFSYSWNSTNKGIDFSGKFGSAGIIWYPAAGYLSYGDGSLRAVGSYGYWWSCTPYSSEAYDLYLTYRDYVRPSDDDYRAYGLSVRCLKEGAGSGEPVVEEPELDFSSAINLSSIASANSYVVSASGTYSFPAVKGNSTESVGDVASAEVLWESFGTNVTPEKGDLISVVAVKDGNIGFRTPSTLKNGNAVIAAKDASGEILWSWHIWVCEGYDPEATAQEYYNNAGVMMDRNLGATSAEPGDVGALGLMYQWGRKDPFLGSSSISRSSRAASTLAWPSAMPSNSSDGTIDYAVKHPTTFITYSKNSNSDWYYTGGYSTDNTRWQRSKTIYDPCPPGWKIPIGGSVAPWSEDGDGVTPPTPVSWDAVNRGINFSGKFGPDDTVWYPAAGKLDYTVGSPSSVGSYGYWWSCTPEDRSAYNLWLTDNGNVLPSDYEYRAYGLSVRCQKEGVGYYPETPVKSIKLNKSKTYLIPTMSAVLTATVLPNNATCATLSWTSSDSRVATVSNSGEVRAVGLGTATITAAATDRSKVSAGVVVTVCPEVVDMGLSVKWRSCNLGASSVEDNGDLIAWGETEPKSEYNCDNYKWYDSSLTGSKITKYNDDDQRTVLEPGDDAARVRLGSSWRMPTKEEFDELISICETEWISVNGTYMLKITNPNNGSWIFLPGGLNYSPTKSASVSIPTKDGVKGDMPMMRDVVGPGGCLDGLCLYWSSSRQLDLEIDKANYLLQYKWYNPMGGVGGGSGSIRQYYRYDGLRIRPVMD